MRNELDIRNLKRKRKELALDSENLAKQVSLKIDIIKIGERNLLLNQIGILDIKIRNLEANNPVNGYSSHDYALLNSQDGRRK